VFDFRLAKLADATSGLSNANGATAAAQQKIQALEGRRAEKADEYVDRLKRDMGDHFQGV
jgi:hypothetical protein